MTQIFAFTLLSTINSYSNRILVKKNSFSIMLIFSVPNKESYDTNLCEEKFDI